MYSSNEIGMRGRDEHEVTDALLQNKVRVGKSVVPQAGASNGAASRDTRKMTRETFLLVNPSDGTVCFSDRNVELGALTCTDSPHARLFAEFE